MEKIMIAGLETADSNYNEIVEVLRDMGRESFISLELSDVNKASHIIFPGSFQDINPERWGAVDEASNDINDNLDQAQWKIMEKAVADKKSVMGICRGMQLINVYFGGTLIQDMPFKEAHIKKEPEQYHQLVTSEKSFMFDLFGPVLEVNSRHHQGVGCVGDNLNVSALWIGEAGLVMEAIEHRELPIIGVQWHPESMYMQGTEEQKKDAEKIFKYFLNK